jgi:hypothetical protein
MLPDLLIEPVVRRALAEDLGRAGDVTAQACIPEGARMRAVFAARKPGVLAGIDCVRLAVLAMDPDASVDLKLRDGDAFEAMAHTLREDGVWVDSGENDNAIVQTLTRTPGSTGVFGYSFLEQNSDTVKAHAVNGVMPTIETIASGQYPISRSMFIYVKKQHVGVTPGLEQFVMEFMSDAAAGRGGYLQDRGLVPMPADQLATQQAVARSMTVMTAPTE